MEKVCNKEGCTYSDTRICLLGHPEQSCPELKMPLDAGDAVDSVDDEWQGPNDELERFLPFGDVMHLADISKMMAGEYTRVIGVLGSPNAGKTAALVSLYLMVCNNRLEGYSYRDSKTLLAFEEISRGARRWNDGNQPDQLTTHTRSLDDRQPGFVHLRLHQDDKNQTVGMVIPDLPGEWTKSFVESNRYDRLEFLESCDVIWIMMDGRDMRDRMKRRVELNAAELLVGRLRQNLEHPGQREIILVVSHADKGEFDDTVLAPICEIAENGGFRVCVHHIASFSSVDDVDPGSGISELLSKSLNGTSTRAQPVWPNTHVAEGRKVMRFNNNGGAS